MNTNKCAVLFVCLGNICRSPLAEGVFRHLVDQRGLSKKYLAASCGTGDWHAGEPAHHQTIKVASKYGINIDSHRARQLCQDDFVRFNLILAMDRSNLRDIKQLAPSTSPEIKLMREYDLESDDLSVPDPYYGGADGFDEVYQILYRSCTELLEQLEGSLR
jgi:protein-tyrosine phosphatase